MPLGNHPERPPSIEDKIWDGLARHTGEQPNSVRGGFGVCQKSPFTPESS
jgi:hypothetical protein